MRSNSSSPEHRVSPKPNPDEGPQTVVAKFQVENYICIRKP